MKSEEYLSYITNCIFEFDNKVRKTEEVTLKAFSYIMTNISEVKDRLNIVEDVVNNNFTYFQIDINNEINNVKLDINTLSDITSSALNNTKDIIKEFDIIHSNVSELENKIINIENAINEVKLDKEGFWSKFKYKLYYITHYFQIKRAYKLKCLEEERLAREAKLKRLAEEEAYRIEQEKLKRLQEERKRLEEERKAEEIKRKAEEEKRLREKQQLELKQQQNKISAILNNIK